MSERPSLMILIAGPYRSGTGDDPDQLAANVRLMESHALPLFRAGHLPIVGEWLALPLCALAGSERIGDAAFEEIFHPIAERMLARCDAVLRVGGPSAGADLMVRVAEERGLRVFHDAAEIPGCDASAPPACAVGRASAAALVELSEPLQSLLTELGATAAAPAVLAYDHLGQQLACAQPLHARQARRHLRRAVAGAQPVRCRCAAPRSVRARARVVSAGRLRATSFTAARRTVPCCTGVIRSRYGARCRRLRGLCIDARVVLHVSISPCKSHGGSVRARALFHSPVSRR